MDKDLRREIILDHYQNPVNRGLTGDSKYLNINTNNESCIDNIDLEVLIEDNIINDIHFDGEACAISTSSTSIMINTFIGKTVDDALNIIENYENMIEEKTYDSSVLEELNVYEDIYKQANRKKCALLSIEGLKKILLEQK